MPKILRLEIRLPDTISMDGIVQAFRKGEVDDKAATLILIAKMLPTRIARIMDVTSWEIRDPRDAPLPPRRASKDVEDEIIRIGKCLDDGTWKSKDTRVHMTYKQEALKWAMGMPSMFDPEN